MGRIGFDASAACGAALTISLLIAFFLLGISRAPADDAGCGDDCGIESGVLAEIAEAPRDLPKEEQAAWIRRRLEKLDNKQLKDVGAALAEQCEEQCANKNLYVMAKTASDELIAERASSEEFWLKLGDWSVAVLVGILVAAATLLSTRRARS